MYFRIEHNNYWITEVLLHFDLEVEWFVYILYKYKIYILLYLLVC